ncbi:unnamed protein product [Effrenium voratum]|uniref:Uncharacterized protein n=1 Tax=Effrenium voratum TaxID=2562239 RepID=A0AA36MJ95_9DINO|nr:unnamed protein product [Effrenium voratum]
METCHGSGRSCQRIGAGSGRCPCSQQRKQRSGFRRIHERQLKQRQRLADKAQVAFGEGDFWARVDANIGAQKRKSAPAGSTAPPKACKRPQATAAPPPAKVGKAKRASQKSQGSWHGLGEELDKAQKLNKLVQTTSSAKGAHEGPCADCVTAPRPKEVKPLEEPEAAPERPARSLPARPEVDPRSEAVEATVRELEKLAVLLEEQQVQEVEDTQIDEEEESEEDEDETFSEEYCSPSGGPLFPETETSSQSGASKSQIGIGASAAQRLWIWTTYRF